MTPNIGSTSRRHVHGKQSTSLPAGTEITGAGTGTGTGTFLEGLSPSQKKRKQATFDFILAHIDEFKEFLQQKRAKSKITSRYQEGSIASSPNALPTPPPQVSYVPQALAPQNPSPPIKSNSPTTLAKPKHVTINTRNGPHPVDPEVDGKIRELDNLLQTILPKFQQPKNHWNILESNPLKIEYQTAPLPAWFEMPSFEKYNGYTDPEAHLKRYTAVMFPYGVNDMMLCRCFACTLTGPALDWYFTIPPGSIESFSQLGDLLLQRFAGSHFLSLLKKPRLHLHTMRQH